MLGTSPGFLSWTSGRATAMDGRQSSGKRREGSDTPQPLLTRAIASMPASGRFPDSPLRGAYANNCVYEGVMGWEAFEPALSRAEEMDAHTIWRCAADIPEEWYEGDRDGLDRLVEALHHRRRAIRNLITEFRRSSRSPFPNWRESPADSAMPLVAADRSLEAQRL